MYENLFTYDANGNILSQQRRDENGVQIDAMSYRYKKNTAGKTIQNRLYSVNDAVNLSAFWDDIDDMGAFYVDQGSGSKEVIYDEGSEWAPIISPPTGGTVSTSATSGPVMGAVHASYDDIPVTGYRGFQRSTQLDVSGYNYLTFFIRNRTEVAPANYLRLYIGLNASGYLTANLPAYGYNRGMVGEWQQISIPLTDLGITGDVNRVWLRPVGGGSDTYDYDVDYMLFSVDAPVITQNDNYAYDEEGRLIRDDQENIASITWRVDGKVSKITRPDTSPEKNLIFDYSLSR